MNIGSELEKLLSLKSQGVLDPLEFEKAKAHLLNDEASNAMPAKACETSAKGELKNLPGLGLAAGVFVGNLLVVSFTSGNIAKGFVVGLIAGIIVIPLSWISRALKSN